MASSVLFFFSFLILAFRFSVHLPRLPPPVAGGMAMTFVDAFFRSSFFFHVYFAGFVALPFRGGRVGFEEPHLRLMVQFVESEFP